MRISSRRFIAILALSVLMPAGKATGQDIPIATSSLVEDVPSVAYNSLAGTYLVAYRVAYVGGGGATRHRVQVQLLNADGSPNGPALFPFSDESFDVLGRPALAYDKDADRFLLAAPVDSSLYVSTGIVTHQLYGDGTNVPASQLFLLSGLSLDDAGKNSVHVLYNGLRGEFVVTVQTAVLGHNLVVGERLSDAMVYDAVALADFGTTAIGVHSIAFAPLGETDPVGGRYLLAAGTGSPLVLLLDSQLAPITPVPVAWGHQDGGVLDHDIAYGEVGGRNMFLVGSLDNNNCRRGYETCPDAIHQWRGIWGTYVNPALTAYLPGPPADASFPISYISYHLMEIEWLGMKGVQGPRLSYAPDAKGFFAVWREVPTVDTVEGLLTHIRGAFVDYYVDNAGTAPLPGAGSNIVISNGTGTCPAPGDPKYPVCESEQDPRFPAVAAATGMTAAVVWRQRYPPNPSDLDVYGDIAAGVLIRPDLVELSVANPPSEGTPGFEIVVDDLVQNQGNTPAVATTTGFYLSTDAVKSRFDILMGTRAVPVLDLGGSASGPISVPIPAGTALGVYYVIACADILAAAAESDESNNCRASSGTIRLVAGAGPDLVETAVGNPPAGAAPGGSISVTDTVANQGGGAGASTTRYYLSADLAKDAGDLLLTGSRAVPILAAGATSSGTVSVTIPGATASGTYHLIACADDLLAVTETSETNNCLASTGTIAVGAAAAKTALDFDGDHKSDILWRHATAGDMWLWPMSGGVKIGDAFVRVVNDANWEIKGQGDLDGDGKADLLWRNKATGAIYYWKMNGATPVQELYIATVAVSYDIVGTGDFDGDGKADILWRNAAAGDLWLWRMNGVTILGEHYVDAVALSYQVKGLGDLNADTKTDVVWQGAGGDVWVWLMNGAARDVQQYVGTVADAAYQIQQVADFDADGKADILWWNAAHGDLWIWPMHGAVLQSPQYAGTVADTNYRIMAAGDYDGDGNADILWRHAVAGDLWVWLMNGPARKSFASIGTVADAGYQVVRTR